MRAQETVNSSNISATTAGFLLSGGQYQISVIATFGGGSVGVDALNIDGVTWVAVITARTTNGVTTFFAPPGMYRVSVVTATAVYTSIGRIPGE